MLLKWDQTYSVMPVETSSGRSLSGCIIQQCSFTSPREKGTAEYLKDRFDFLFTCMDVDGRRGEENRDGASRCSLDGHQGNLPRFSNWSTGLLGCITGGRFGKVCYFERLLTATMSWQLIDHFSLCVPVSFEFNSRILICFCGSSGSHRALKSAFSSLHPGYAKI